MHNLKIDDFARLFGIREGEMPGECRDLINNLDFHYTVLEGVDRDKVILEVFRTLGSELPIPGPDRVGVWERGWSENLEEFVDSGFDSKSLVPFYNRPGKRVMRLQGQYISPKSLNFEADFLGVLKRWIAKRFFPEVDHVYEFGCGPAHNLMTFGEIYPDKCYHGFDWATASQEIIQRIVDSNGIRVSGQWFDMFSPDKTCQIEPNSAVVTFDSMEQLGGRFGPFLDYLLLQSPKLCIHIEPLQELYDTSILPDYLAAAYSKRRNYLNGFLTALRKLEQSSEIVIHDVRKILGSLYQDGWSLVVWSRRDS